MLDFQFNYYLITIVLYWDIFGAVIIGISVIGVGNVVISLFLFV